MGEENEFNGMFEKENDFLSSLNREFKINELFEKHNITYPSMPEEEIVESVDEHLGINTPAEEISKLGGIFLGYSETVIEPIVKTSRPWPHSTRPWQQTTRQQTIRPWSASLDDEIDRLIRTYDDEKTTTEHSKRESIIDKLKALSGKTDTVKEQRKQVLKSGFLNLLRDKIDFDDDGNLIDSNGTIMRSTGQVGLMFTRILNEMLENRKNPDQIENDLKEIFK